MLMHHKEEVYQWISERADVQDSEETEDEKKPKSKSRSPTKENQTEPRSVPG